MVQVKAICDRCGKEYDAYYPKKMAVKHFFNGVMLVAWDTKRNYHRKIDFDLCKDCVDGLHEFLTGHKTGERPVNKPENVDQADTNDEELA